MDAKSLNPALTVCFFCHKDAGIVLLKKSNAPKRLIINYEPCAECEAKMKQGVTCIEVVTYDNDAMPIQEGAWPTGRWCLIKRSAAALLFKDKIAPRVLLEDTLYKKLIGE